MISFKCSSILAAAMICVSAARAREVDLVRFSPFAVAASNEQGAVGAALSTHLDGLIESSDAPFTSTSCPQHGYRPAWWLTPEVENRRGAYFAAMSAIACENGLPEGLLDAVITQESGYRGDYTKVTYLHAKGEQIRYDASRCYSQAFLPLLCGAALRAPIWEGGNPIDQRSR